ncbi:MAG: M23 family metallopeptidase [Gemmatimonadota bacterium]|jgi:murein DD-endopeptidase MepM/ murein hydrolase activator NlpD
MRSRLRTILVLALATVAGCNPVERVRERFFDGPTPRDRYVQMLEWAGLENTALAKDWLEAGERALREAVPARTPHAEEIWLPPEQAGALGFRVSARRGQRLTITAGLRGDGTALLFLDAFRMTGDSLSPYRHEASADSAARVLELEPRRDADYIIRIQPELLRGGRLSVRIELDATLAFPVEGGRSNDIGSRFGAPRDGGARDHHGVDIFARRGTPALAATSARVSRVETTPIGGRVVWLRDARRNQSLYYAHLDSQYVSTGARLEPGDTVGFIGNTGNARTTPPHLHFGVYSRGPVDPWPFIIQPSAQLPPLTADTSHVGHWVRTRRDRVRIAAAPGSGAGTLMELPRNTAIRVLSAGADWYRVEMPDGGIGYVTAAATESADLPVDVAVLDTAGATLAAPLADADVIEEIGTGTTLDVFGRFGEYLLVRRADGPLAWLPGPAEPRPN